MTYLLDVSTLLARLWRTHAEHQRVKDWEGQQSVAVCPITELGFLRISTQPVFGASMSEARQMLERWCKERQPRFVPCDLAALESAPAPTSGRTTDFYLASLAARHGMLWATLDENCHHSAAFLIPA